MIIPLTCLDDLNKEGFTEAGFLFDNKDEVEIALMKSSENLTGEHYDISLKPEKNGEYALNIVSKHDGFDDVIRKHIKIGDKKMSMRIRYNDKNLIVMRDLAGKFTDYINE